MKIETLLILSYRQDAFITLANFELIPMQIRSMPNLGLVGARVERLDWALGSTNL